mgnify:CR=1 FL=1
MLFGIIIKRLLKRYCKYDLKTTYVKLRVRQHLKYAYVHSSFPIQQNFPVFHNNGSCMYQTNRSLNYRWQIKIRSLYARTLEHTHKNYVNNPSNIYLDQSLIFYRWQLVTFTWMNTPLQINFMVSCVFCGK